ncbi:hypothetical protein [Klebsiella pneumoniae]|uniref:hypothetical protein n=1 Tax=Klebsiella pneumoniae TaxID=573 RepID=UPI00111E4CA5|nr:hypothetical protein [Klebsiella pneumoniae]TNK09009.1 hypothetical protein CI662_027700 [Klebsiella pneumoniae subsp. pneumoniae]
MKRSLLREKIYESEKEIISSIINNNDISELLLNHQKLIMQTNDELNKNTNNSIMEIIEMTSEIKMDKELLISFQFANYELAANEINNEEFNASKNFVSDLLDCNLSRICWTHLEKSVSINSEGSLWPCGDEEHHIFTYPNDDGITSTDLLVHELGHAADYTISRGLNDDNLLAGHVLLRESVAFYCQYTYLSQKGSKNTRLISLGGFLFTYLTILILRYCFEKKISLDNLNVSEAIKDPIFHDFISSYSHLDHTNEYGMNFISERMNAAKDRFVTLGNLVINEIAPRMGIIFGLLLLGKPMETIKRLSQENSMKKNLSSIIAEYIPEYKTSLSDISTIFRTYINN